MRLNTEKYNILLASRCLSVSELSKSCGISTVTLRKLNNGSTARPQTIGKVAKALEVDVTEIIEN